MAFLKTLSAGIAGLFFANAAHASSTTFVTIEMNFDNVIMDDIEYLSGPYTLGGTLIADLIYSSTDYLTNPNAVFMELWFDTVFNVASISLQGSSGDYEFSYTEQGALSFYDQLGAYFGTGLYVQSDTRPFSESSDIFDEMTFGLGTTVLDDLFKASVGDTFTYDAATNAPPGTEVLIEEYLWDSFNSEYLRLTSEVLSGTVGVEVTSHDTFVSPAPIPLPAGLPLLAVGIGTFAVLRRRQSS